MSLIFPDAQPWDFVLFAIAAVMIFLNRKQMFQPGSGITEVLSLENKE